jgi:hypothetical protein
VYEPRTLVSARARRADPTHQPLTPANTGPRHLPHPHQGQESPLLRLCRPESRRPVRPLVLIGHERNEVIQLRMRRSNAKTLVGARLGHQVGEFAVPLWTLDGAVMAWPLHLLRVSDGRNA